MLLNLAQGVHKKHIGKSYLDLLLKELFMKFNLNAKQMLGIVGLFAPCAAYAQLGAIRQSTFHPTSFSAEVKPLALGVSAIPGVASFGLGAEITANNNFATFANAYIVDANLPNNMRNKGNEAETPQIQKMTGYAADLGARYYGSGSLTDSWYGGVKLGYQFSQGQWGYKEEKVDQSIRSLTPGAEAGYRWLWSNNLLLRAGAGADANLLQENTVTPNDISTAVTDDASDKVTGYAKVAVLPRVDVGLGYAF